MKRRAVLLHTTPTAWGLIFGTAVMVAWFIGILGAAKPAHAATTFTVNSAFDGHDLDFPGGTFDKSSDGKCDAFSTVGNQCTLRAAIQQANVTAGADTINFNIPSSDSNCNATTKVCTITVFSDLFSDLPPITKPVTIDGYTQGDATADTSDDATENTFTQPGKSNAVPKILLRGQDTQTGVRQGTGLTIHFTSNVVVKGLVINNFLSGILLRGGGTGHKIEGNFIGTDPSGYNAPEGNGFGVLFDATNGSTLGGTSPAARNLISGNTTGVALFPSASANKIQGNLIGVDKNGGPLGNGGGGGVAIYSPPNSPLSNGNRILSNSIYSNGSRGIDLMADGVTPNDLDDPSTPKPDPDKDIGANNLQNFPVLDSATILLGNTTITGELTSTPSTRKKKRTFTIQFFSSPAADPSGYGEGKTFLGEIQVKTDRQGNTGPFTFAPDRYAVSEGEFITATATRNSTGDTSEFSAAKPVNPA